MTKTELEYVVREYGWFIGLGLGVIAILSIALYCGIFRR